MEITSVLEYLSPILSVLSFLPDQVWQWPLYFFVFPVYALWLFYLAIMNLKRAKDAGTMTRTALILALPIGIIGYVIDIVVNVTIGTILFMEFPHYARLTLSARMSYLYVEGSTDWRSKLADWFARNLLNSYDPSGKHID